ncbi:aminodeoxychorismate synthase component I [Leeia aquatica]|uniref:Aminodeoxychorismate synthase component I n=1 Tax=Leeia aquatica TaxID=2725557 RepID=A0A847RXH4_9NEIS|nr:aminodeoxychorismate synthase component I [Leeia aquatica]NLR74441.1 aminodeoxychorismate synthase component I [Leeia aquatica]
MSRTRIHPLDIVPDLFLLAARNPAQFPVLLQSSGPEGWDILLACPQPVALSSPDALFTVLDAAWRAEQQPVDPDLAELPFRGGWFVYCGYELLHEIEPTVPRFPATPDFPQACLLRVPAAILHRRDRNQSMLLLEDDAAHLLPQLLAACHDASPLPPWPPARVTALNEEDPAVYLRNIQRVKQYIHEGDVFQVNLSRRWAAEVADGFDPRALYRQLREVNPAPFSGLACLPDGEGQAWVVSASPERLLRVSHQAGERRAETRPIAGTHPRSTDPDEDAALKARLLASRKERAEHIMLVDLERNDLGRVCKPGSVKVDELMAVASYAFVHHIESNVHGNLRDDISPAQAIRALFPGGTITGCPKVRTMQIVRELETSPRYAYTGSMGFVNRDGSLDMNILIRSFMYAPHRADGALLFRAGGGIVADSDPERELNETRAKVRGLLRALGIQQ